MNQLYLYFLYESSSGRGLEEAIGNLKESESNRENVAISGDDHGLSIEYQSLTAQLRQRKGLTGETQVPVADVPHVYININEKDIPANKFTNAEIMGMSDDYLQSINEIVDVVSLIYELLDPKPAVAYGLTESDWTMITETEEMSIPITKDGLRNNEFTFIPWLVIATEDLINAYGRETLLSTPSWRTEELNDGSIFVVSYANVLTQSEGPIIPRNEHFGIDVPLEEE
jgi:hypothetical protein